METDNRRHHTEGENPPLLQVMICAFGHDGLRRVAKASHPRVEGVEYLVSYQAKADESEYPLPDELKREDFKVFRTSTKGLSVNRNTALSLAEAPLLLISDDDADYTADGLRSVIDAFEEHPEAALLAFRYASASSQKRYPDEAFSLDSPPKGYSVSSIEIAFRRSDVQGKIWFNENFGIGAPFPSGEEDIFVRDCLDSGLKGLYIPKTIVRHDAPTTSARNLMLESRPLTKGAVFLRLHPRDWPLRMLVHALREVAPWRKGLVPSPLSYCRNWLKGVRQARRMKVFPTPDLSLQYDRHE